MNAVTVIVINCSNLWSKGNGNNNTTDLQRLTAHRERAETVSSRPADFRTREVQKRRIYEADCSIANYWHCALRISSCINTNIIPACCQFFVGFSHPPKRSQLTFLIGQCDWIEINFKKMYRHRRRQDTALAQKDCLD